MAEIQVERKPRSHAGLLMGLLLLIAVLGAGWYFTMGPGAGATVDDGPDLQQAPPAASAPAPSPAPPGGLGPTQGPETVPTTPSPAPGSLPAREEP